MYVVLILRWCNYRLLFAVLLPVLPFQKADLAFQSQALEIRKAALENEVAALWCRGQRAFRAPIYMLFLSWGKPFNPSTGSPFLRYSLKKVAEGFDCSTLQTLQRDLAETVWGFGNFLQKMVNPLWHVET